MTKIIFNIRFLLLLTMVVAVFSCNDDDNMAPDGTSSDPVASFTFQSDSSDPLTVMFSNFSQNASSYAWEFGDGGTSTEEAPTYTYNSTGTYMVVLTATGADGTSARTESLTVVGTIPVASFSSEINGLTVIFTNSSANATSYAWDFGEGGTSSAENPEYTYSMAGTYTVMLTASDDMGESDVTTSEVEVVVPFSPAILSSPTGKVWKLDGEGSYAVGASSGSSEWWFIGQEPGDFAARSCQFDDEWIFFDDGTLEFDSKGIVWGEAYMGVDPPACVDDSALPSPYDVFASGTHTFSATATQITATGNGAYIGFNKAYNGAELDGITAPANEIVYEILEYTNDGSKETVTFTLDYGGGFWTMRIFSEN